MTASSVPSDAESPTESMERETAPSSVRELLTGISDDLIGVDLIGALDDALCLAHDVPSVERALSVWAGKYSQCDAVELVTPADDSKSRGLALEETVNAHGCVTFTVRTGLADVGSIAFQSTLLPQRTSASLRRLILLAGRIGTSRIAQLSASAITVQVSDSSHRPSAFVGTSRAAEKLVHAVPRLASSKVSVLLTGETGVGKTFVARLVHEGGARKHEPFRVINCGSIPENLVETELFGHERGSFTGAVTSRAGVLEAAGRGTVLLDEIGELPISSQVKLLRALEERRFERVGSNRTIRLEARILAATNRDLDAMVAAGTFRSDLFFRISVVKLHVPALREREGDVVLLAERLLQDAVSSEGRRVEGFSADALAMMRAYSWPGNVRELRNAIEHAVVFGDGRLVEPEELPLAIHNELRAAPRSLPEIGHAALVHLPAPLDWLERRAIEEALRATDGNKARAAALLGIKLATLYYKIRRI